MTPPSISPGLKAVLSAVSQIETAVSQGQHGQVLGLFDVLENTLVQADEDHVDAAAEKFDAINLELGKEVQAVLANRLQDVRDERKGLVAKQLVSDIEAIPTLPAPDQPNAFESVLSDLQTRYRDDELTPTVRKAAEEGFGRVRPLGFGDSFLMGLLSKWSAENDEARTAKQMEIRRQLLAGEFAGSLRELLAILRFVTKSRGGGNFIDDGVDSAKMEELVAPDCSIDVVAEMATKAGAQVPPQTIAQAAVGWIEHHGGRYFRVDGGPRFLLIDAEVLEISSSDRSPFSGWLYKVAGVSVRTPEGKAIIDGCLAHAQRAGVVLDCATWTRASVDRKGKPEVLIHLHQADETVLALTPGRAEIQENGKGDELILVRFDKVKPISFNAKASSGSAAKEKLKHLFLDRLACAPHNRWFLLCYTLAVLLRDLAEVHPALHVTGDSDAGKSFMTKLMTALLYGQKVLIIPTTAASYSLASKYPLLVLDNKETKSFSDADKMFLLVAVTRAEKAKRTIGTESDVTFEDPNACVAFSGIEAQGLTELRNRCYSVEADARYWAKNKRLRERSALDDLARARDEILSWLFHILAEDILPAIEQGRIDEIYDETCSLIRRGEGDRGAEFLALMRLWLDALAPRFDEDAEAIYLEWLREQAAAIVQDQVHGSVLSLALTAILEDLRQKDGDPIPFRSKAQARGLVPYANASGLCGFSGTMNMIFLAAKDLVPRFDIQGGDNLRRRFHTEMATLNREGWYLEKTKRRSEGFIWDIRFTGQAPRVKGIEIDEDHPVSEDQQRGLAAVS